MRTIIATKENFTEESLKDEEYLYGEMVKCMKENFMRDLKKDLELGENQKQALLTLENGNAHDQMDMEFMSLILIHQQELSMKANGKMGLNMDQEQSSIEILEMSMSAIFIMVSHQEKVNIFGHLELFLKGNSKMDLSMDLANGKKEWEMEQIYTKVNINLTNDQAMEHSNGVLQEVLIEDSSKKT